MYKDALSYLTYNMNLYSGLLLKGAVGNLQTCPTERGSSLYNDVLSYVMYNRNMYSGHLLKGTVGICKTMIIYSRKINEIIIQLVNIILIIYYNRVIQD